MITITCSLRFKDGKKIVASVSAETPYDEREVVYAGDTRGLPRVIRTATPGLLKILFKNIADETGAEFSIDTQGEYAVEE